MGERASRAFGQMRTSASILSLHSGIAILPGSILSWIVTVEVDSILRPGVEPRGLLVAEVPKWRQYFFDFFY
jgi:hypothetical protein